MAISGTNNATINSTLMILITGATFYFLLCYADTLPIRERFVPLHERQTSPPQCVQYLAPQLPHLYTEKDFS